MTDIVAAMRALVQRFVGELTYLRVWAGAVELQHSDGSCDVRFDAPALADRGLQRVPVMVSPAGCSARVEPGTRCLVGFVDGDPRKPRIVAWAYERASATVSLDGGTRAVARNGDLVELALSPSAPVSGVVQGTVQTTNPSPPPPTLPVAVPAGTQFAGVVLIPAPVRGRVFGGAARVKA